MITSDVMAKRIAQRETGLVAAGTSWRWPLYDRTDQPIGTGAQVKWMANGLARAGLVVGSPKEGEAEVEEVTTKRRLRIAARLLTVLAVDTEQVVAEVKRDLDPAVLVTVPTSSQPEPDTVPTPKITHGIAASVTPGDVLCLPDSTYREVLRVVAETSGGRTFLQRDLASGGLSLSILASSAPVVTRSTEE